MGSSDLENFSGQLLFSFKSCMIYPTNHFYNQGVFMMIIMALQSACCCAI